MATDVWQDVLIWGPPEVNGCRWRVQQEAQEQTATVNVGTTTTSAPGGNADVQNVGSENAAVLNFTIPRGEKGTTVMQGRNKSAL